MCAVLSIRRRLMNVPKSISHDLLTDKIESLKRAIRSWAQAHHLWYDCGFKTYQEHYDDRPEGNPCVLVLSADGPLYYVIGQCANPDRLREFEAIVEASEFCFERYERGVVWFHTKEESLVEQYKRYFDFEWICTWLAPDFSEVYAELFTHFSTHPDDFLRLTPRQFEQLTQSVFRNQGYRTVLGPGRGDGGIDLRLYKNDVIGEVLTLVQVKRYASRPIRLDAVAALSAVVEDERANRGLFLTTSRFLPSALRFAQRQNHRIELADSADLQRWCEDISRRIYHGAVIDAQDIERAMRRPQGLVGRIVRARTGYGITRNDFCLVVKETPTAALLLKLSQHRVSGDGQVGTEVPDLAFPGNLNSISVANNTFPARKKTSVHSGESYLWGNRELFTVWDGKPAYFNYLD